MIAAQSGTDWDPGLYLRFERARTRPALDLATRLAQVIGSGIECAILDIGCGPGNSTAALREAFPRAALEGLDSSALMIEKARSSGLDALWIHADVLERAAAHYPERADGSVFFPFRRIFSIASKTKNDRGGIQ